MSSSGSHVLLELQLDILFYAFYSPCLLLSLLCCISPSEMHFGFSFFKLYFQCRQSKNKISFLINTLNFMFYALSSFLHVLFDCVLNLLVLVLWNLLFLAHSQRSHFFKYIGFLLIILMFEMFVGLFLIVLIHSMFSLLLCDLSFGMCKEVLSFLGVLSVGILKSSGCLLSP